MLKRRKKILESFMLFGFKFLKIKKFVLYSVFIYLRKNYKEKQIFCSPNILFSDLKAFYSV